MPTRSIAPPVPRFEALPHIEPQLRGSTASPRAHRSAYDARAEPALARKRLHDLAIRGASIGLTVLALADVLADIEPLRGLSWILGVLVAGMSSLMSAAVAERTED